MTGPTRFQAKTIAYVIKRFWGDAKPARRFLVADEVGLGKTIVAREVIAEALRRKPGEDIDIVYLCSSQPVASQNLKRLKVHGHGSATKATRLTLFALEKRKGVRYFALTPTTSFNVAGRSGLVRERALIYFCLRGMFTGEGVLKILQQVSDRTWIDHVEAIENHDLDQTVIKAFRQAVAADDALKAEVRALGREALVERTERPEVKAFNKKRDALVGRLRKELALQSAQALASNGLIVVDEFQRFASLFDISSIEKDFGVRLADRLLTEAIPDRRVLLLSATPYRISGGELRPDEKPYADFVALVRFLAGDDTATELADELDTFARALRARPPIPAEVIGARDAAQAILRKIMCRTERTSATVDANAMVTEDVRPLASDGVDLGGAIAARRLSVKLKVRDPVEYWKSAPYFLDFMRDYQFREAAVGAAEKDRRFVSQQARIGNLLLDQPGVRRLDPIVPPSARLRDLIKNAIPDKAERLLWVPPSLPYLMPSPLFAGASHDLKRLIFSEWRLAPDAIAALTSYEIEQRLAAGLRASRATGKRRAERAPGQRHKRFGDLGNMLRLGRANQASDEPTLSMIPLALLLSGPRMAAWGDPLPAAIAAGTPVDATAFAKLVGRPIRAALKKILPAKTEGRVDDRWYWAAPLLLEGEPGIRQWLGLADPFLASKEVASVDLERVTDAISSILDDPDQLGRQPKNLVAVLSRLAVTGPGNCAYRALSRTAAGPVSEAQLRQSAFHVARGFQSLFNQGEAAAAVQLEYPGTKRVYWDQVLDYCLFGNLQALLDEQLHFETDGLAMFEGTPEEKLVMAANLVHASLTLRRASIDVRGLERRRRRDATTSTDFIRLRCRHAVRFAEIKEADGAVSRLDAVRAAFNSPFRPFVLASTAVGQEGLDFHPWCHAVVHWNLPRSPVELEQREGRVHRYKGHAVRLNVARFLGLAGLALVAEPSSAEVGAPVDTDPWKRLFAIAARHDVDNDLSPCWLFEQGENPTKIRRIVPYLNHSREAEGWPKLRARLATYRLVIGLPRQEDLLDAIERNGITAEQASDWKIDLRPPPLPG